VAKCLVLGATGFIGRHIVEELTNRNHEVKAFGRHGEESLFKNNQLVEEVYGDFLNRSDLASALNGAEYVFHFISTTTPATAENDPLVDIDTNIRMTVELLEEAVKWGTKKVIFASTGGAIYGINNDRSFSEVDLPQPISPYAIGKLTIEHYLHYYKVKHGLNSVSMRISNPYGEGQSLHRKQGVIPIFMENIYNDQPLTILGDGTMVRDYIYVKDVANMICEAFDKDTDKAVYNLGSGRGATVNELVRLIEAITGKVAKLTYQPTPATFVQQSVLNIDQFKNDFGVEPRTSLDKGMRATWSYIVAEHEKEGMKID